VPLLLARKGEASLVPLELKAGILGAWHILFYFFFFSSLPLILPGRKKNSQLPWRVPS
jgi:hypothetical protein